MHFFHSNGETVDLTVSFLLYLPVYHIQNMCTLVWMKVLRQLAFSLQQNDFSHADVEELLMEKLLDNIHTSILLLSQNFLVFLLFSFFLSGYLDSQL